jgi:hypothetical protein
MHGLGLEHHCSIPESAGNLRSVKAQAQDNALGDRLLLAVHKRLLWCIEMLPAPVPSVVPACHETAELHATVTIRDQLCLWSLSYAAATVHLR